MDKHIPSRRSSNTPSHFNSGLQITISHWTMADQNLPMSDEIPTVVGHNVRRIIFAFNANTNALDVLNAN